MDTNLNTQNRAKVTAEPGKQQILVTREFNYPRELVMRAYTDPELLPQWWGTAVYTTQVEVLDAKPGGRWRFLQSDADGRQEAFRGVYHQVTPDLVIYTFEYEGMPDHVALETVRLIDLEGGRTRVEVNTVFQTLEDRDGMVASGMEGGMQESYQRLDKLLAGL